MKRVAEGEVNNGRMKAEGEVNNGKMKRVAEG